MESRLSATERRKALEQLEREEKNKKEKLKKKEKDEDEDEEEDDDDDYDESGDEEDDDEGWSDNENDEVSQKKTAEKIKETTECKEEDRSRSPTPNDADSSHPKERAAQESPVAVEKEPQLPTSTVDTKEASDHQNESAKGADPTIAKQASDISNIEGVAPDTPEETTKSAEISNDNNVNIDAISSGKPNEAKINSSDENSDHHSGNDNGNNNCSTVIDNSKNETDSIQIEKKVASDQAHSHESTSESSSGTENTSETVDIQKSVQEQETDISNVSVEKGERKETLRSSQKITTTLEEAYKPTPSPPSSPISSRVKRVRKTRVVSSENSTITPLSSSPTFARADANESPNSNATPILEPVPADNSSTNNRRSVSPTTESPKVLSEILKAGTDTTSNRGHSLKNSAPVSTWTASVSPSTSRSNSVTGIHAGSTAALPSASTPTSQTSAASQSSNTVAVAASPQATAASPNASPKPKPKPPSSPLPPIPPQKRNIMPIVTPGSSIKHKRSRSMGGGGELGINVNVVEPHSEESAANLDTTKPVSLIDIELEQEEKRRLRDIKRQSNILTESLTLHNIFEQKNRSDFNPNLQIGSVKWTAGEKPIPQAPAISFVPIIPTYPPDTVVTPVSSASSTASSSSSTSFTTSPSAQQAKSSLSPLKGRDRDSATLVSPSTGHSSPSMSMRKLGFGSIKKKMMRGRKEVLDEDKNKLKDEEGSSTSSIEEYSSPSVSRKKQKEREKDAREREREEEKKQKYEREKRQRKDLMTYITRPLLSVADDMDHNMQMLYMTVNELVVSERMFVQDLIILVREFYEPLKKLELLSSEDLSVLFGNAQVLLEQAEQMLARLETDVIRLEGLRIAPSLECITKMHKVWEDYCANHTNSSNILEKLTADSSQFRDFLNEQLERPTMGGLPLGAYLIKPVQRLCKYPLLLNELIKYTSSDNLEEKEALTNCLKSIEMMVNGVNETKRNMEMLQRINTLAQRLDDPSATVRLVAPHRVIVKEGWLKDMDSTADSYFVLFNDMLARFSKTTKGRKKDRLHLIDTIPLYSLSVGPLVHVPVPFTLPNEVIKMSLEILVGSKTSRNMIRVYATSIAEKEEWFKEINRIVEDFSKHAELPKSVSGTSLSSSGNAGTASPSPTNNSPSRQILQQLPMPRGRSSPLPSLNPSASQNSSPPASSLNPTNVSPSRIAPNYKTARTATVLSTQPAPVAAPKLKCYFAFGKPNQRIRKVDLADITNMAMLIERIRKEYEWDPSAMLVVTYVDSDGDVIEVSPSTSISDLIADAKSFRVELLAEESHNTTPTTNNDSSNTNSNANITLNTTSPNSNDSDTANPTGTSELENTSKN